MKSIYFLSIFIFLLSCSPNEETEKSSAENLLKESKSIPGLKWEDIEQKFKAKGFSSEKQTSMDGSCWETGLEKDGVLYAVRVFSKTDANTVDHIWLSALSVDPLMNNADSMKAFLKFGCAISYEDANCKKIEKFIDKNYSHDKSFITLSDIKYTIYTPTKFTRMITIEKVNE